MKQTSQHHELNELLERLCENRQTVTDVARIEEIVLSDVTARSYYLEYMQLHGTLYWDAAGGITSSAVPVTTAEFTSTPQPVATGLSRRWVIVFASTVALLAVGWFLQDHFSNNNTTPTNIVKQQPNDSNNLPVVVKIPADDNRKPHHTLPEKPPRLTHQNKTVAPKNHQQPVIAVIPQQPVIGKTTESVVSYINNRIELGWHEGEMKPSSVATDEEWVRRIHLDLTGQIPSGKVVDAFAKNRQPEKHADLIDNLLKSPAYSSHLTTIWANLLIGRDASRDVNRASLELFLSNSFANNHSWDQISADLISAEGDAIENGAANFLLANLNNQAVPATAITARLFLGTQVQCTQCHDHPFNDWKQNQFWELNCFFKQTKKVRSPKSNRVKLVSQPKGGPTYYENLRGVMRVAYPKYSGNKVDPSENTNRRKELARLIATGDKPLLAKAMVNRMWAHFMGFGFTHPIDDMGPHNPPTHPELLDQLTIQFVESGYDIQQLIRWICNSRPYHLTSQYNESNQSDDPEAGHAPLFSRMYVKAMSAEQLFDSLEVATGSHQKRTNRMENSSPQRQQWLQQFVFAFETEENDELMDFNGTVPQALMMMNGSLMHDALDIKPGSLLHHIARRHSTERERIRQLYLVTLSRYPSAKELAVVRKMLRTQRKARFANSSKSRKQTLAEEYQDILWALLNSNEFLLVH